MNKKENISEQAITSCHASSLYGVGLGLEKDREQKTSTSTSTGPGAPRVSSPLQSRSQCVLFGPVT
jgi:hypothetical protein